MKSVNNLSPPSPWLHFTKVGCFFLALALACLTAPLAAEDDGPPRFHEVNGWRGTLTASATVSQETMDMITGGLSGLNHTFQYDAVQNVDFLLEEYESDPSIWTGKVVSSSYEASYRFTHRTDGTHQEDTFNTTGPMQFDEGDSNTVRLYFHRSRGWSVGFPTLGRPTESHHRVTFPEGETFRSQYSGTSRGMGTTNTHPYPARGMTLFASMEKKGEEGFPGPGVMPVTPGVTWDYAIYLEPTSLEELKLEIEEPSGYATWRPETTPERADGPPLGVKARVVTKSGGQPKTHVESFIWELEGTSREPGVALNFPLDAKKDKPDLELDADGEHFVLSQEKQKMERAVQSGWSDEVKIVPYDWGGWSTLQVTAVLTDGRRVKGKLKGKSEYGLLVPKRSRESHIADGWKDRNKSGADDLDDDKVEGQTDDGDGYTLYEEYRGWVVDGKHVEGDPEEKDFFVLNLIGADAIGGLQLFARESKLRVHHRLRPTEMSEEKRLMNGNHHAGAHRVDQHGVFIINRDGTGVPAAGTTGMTNEDATRAFRPGRVREVVIESRAINDATFGRESSVGFYNLTERDAAFAYDRAVAHELLHVVGVDHHGEGEHTAGYYFQSASDPINASHRVGFTTSIPSTKETDLWRGEGYVYTGSELAMHPVVTFIWEDTRRDVAEELAPIYERKLAAERAERAANPPPPAEDPGRWAVQFPQYGKDASYWRESDLFNAVAYRGKEFELHVTISEIGQADSGHELCLMRYYFANAYPVKGREKTYYLVRPGANRAGRTICRAPEGTGANAPSHEPQPRFGDSAAGRGNCFAQICPNDAIPPRKI